MKRDLELEATIVEKFVAIESVLDERSRRLWAAAESRAIGYGGDAVVSAASGLARTTIRMGRREIESGVEHGRLMRRPGAGRPSIESSQPGVKAALEKLVDPLTRGDPCSPVTMDVQESSETHWRSGQGGLAGEFDDGWAIASRTWL